jgi:hypothetical protein
VEAVLEQRVPQHHLVLMQPAAVVMDQIASLLCHPEPSSLQKAAEVEIAATTQALRKLVALVVVVVMETELRQLEDRGREVV